MKKENVKNFEKGIAEIPKKSIRDYFDDLEKFCHDNNVDYYSMSEHSVNCQGKGFALFGDKTFVILENGIWNFAE